MTKNAYHFELEGGVEAGGKKGDEEVEQENGERVCHDIKALDHVHAQQVQQRKGSQAGPAGERVRCHAIKERLVVLKRRVSERERRDQNARGSPHAAAHQRRTMRRRQWPVSAPCRK